MQEGDKFKAEMKKFKVKGKELAALLGITEASMSNKKNGKAPLWPSEAFMIHEYLKCKGSALTKQELFG